MQLFKRGWKGYVEGDAPQKGIFKVTLIEEGAITASTEASNILINFILLGQQKHVTFWGGGGGGGVGVLFAHKKQII